MTSNSIRYSAPYRLNAAIRLILNWLKTQTRAVASIEFALVGSALILFLMAIINLGLLGFSLGALERATEGSARSAAMYASRQYSNTGTMICPSNTIIVSTFNQYSHPPLPDAGTASSSNPKLNIVWTNNSDGTVASDWHGVYLTLTSTYRWSPFGLTFASIPLSVTAAATVMGSFDIPTVVATSCQT